MKRLIKSTVLAGVSALLLTGSINLMAQPADQPPVQGGPRNRQFNPAQMMQRMKESMGVTNDEEWKLISERLTKVMELRRDSMMGGRGGMGRRGGDQGGPGGGATVNPTVDALEKAIEANDAKEIKAKLTTLREERAKKQIELKAAQDKLKEVLTPKQEAQLVLRGMLE